MVVATSTLANDDVIVNYAKSIGVEVFRGDENDVLDRFYQCAKTFDEKTIIRICADSPFVDFNIIDDVIIEFEKGHYDYLSNSIKKQKNEWIQHFNGFPEGLIVEIFSFTALANAWKDSVLPYDREHVTEYIFHNPKIFKLGNLESKTDYSHLRLVVDYQEDFKLIQTIIENFDPNEIFTLSKIDNYLDKHHELKKINSKHNLEFFKTVNKEKNNFF